MKEWDKLHNYFQSLAISCPKASPLYFVNAEQNGGKKHAYSLSALY